MNETLAILALDAADVDLVERFGCENMQLEQYGVIDSFAYDREVPVTWEVWPAVVTGRHPREMRAVEMEWSNPVFNFAQNFTRVLPARWREVLGSPFRENHVDGFKEVEADHMLDATPNWPGVSGARDLKRSWDIMESAASGDLSRGETFDLLVEQFGSQLGWLSAASERNGGIVGVHSHILDTAGHLYARDEEECGRYYRKADSMIGERLAGVDNLLIISDHGMQVSFLDDEDPGIHSWRPLEATNMDGGLPGDVLRVRDWAEGRSSPYDSGPGPECDDGVLQQLDDLGYT